MKYYIRTIASFSLLFFITVTLGQQIGLTLPLDSTRAIIPYQSRNGLIIIDVNINGRMLLPFIVDTSVGHTILTDKAIGDELRLNYLRKIPIATGPDGPMYGYAANELNLELAGGVMSGDNHSIMVMENDYFGLSTIAMMPVYGLIGRDIFERFIVEINQDKNLLILYDSKNFTPPSGYDAVPLTFDNDRPKIQVKGIFENWDEQSGNMSVKTGAPHTILFDSDQNIFNVPPRKVETILGVGGDGEVLGYVGRVRKVQIGKYTFENPIASFTKDQIKGSDRNSIGMGLLSRFDMIFDFSRSLLLVKPNKLFGKTFEFDMSGIKVEPTDNMFVISFVQENSPAAIAGLKVEDLILEINGEVLTTDNFNQIMSTFSTKPDKKIMMKVIQNDTEKEISFKLTRFI